MIRLYSYSSEDSSALTHSKNLLAQRIVESNKLFYIYSRSEYLQLGQSILRHDIFLNTISDDRSGRMVQLGDGDKIDNLSQVVLIKNAELLNVLKPFEELQTKLHQSGFVLSSIESLIVSFLQLSLKNGNDLVSTSELTWVLGD